MRDGQQGGSGADGKENRWPAYMRERGPPLSVPRHTACLQVYQASGAQATREI